MEVQLTFKWNALWNLQVISKASAQSSLHYCIQWTAYCPRIHDSTCPAPSHAFGNTIPCQVLPEAPAVFALGPSPSIQLAKRPREPIEITSNPFYAYHGVSLFPIQHRQAPPLPQFSFQHPTQKCLGSRLPGLNCSTKTSSWEASVKIETCCRQCR